MRRGVGPPMGQFRLSAGSGVDAGKIQGVRFVTERKKMAVSQISAAWIAGTPVSIAVQ